MNHPYVRGAIVIVIVVAATVLAMTGNLEPSAFEGLAILVLGYVFGKASNGVDGLVKVLAMMNPPKPPSPPSPPSSTSTPPTLPPFDPKG